MTSGKFYQTLSDSIPGLDTTKHHINIGLFGNKQVWILSDLVNEYSCEIDELMVEYKKNNYIQNQQINTLFSKFRPVFRKLVHRTKGAILSRSPSDREKKVVEDSINYLKKPYGSFDIKILTKLAHEYVDMLTYKGITPIEAGVSKKSGTEKFLQG